MTDADDLGTRPGPAGIPLDAAQWAAVTSSAMPLALVAPAGSGKTRVVAARIAHRIRNDDADPSHVLCVTFTRKAADELRVRLRTTGIRDRIEAGTFHGVAWRQLRDRWAAKGRTPPALLDQVRPFLREQVGVSAPAEVAELAAEIAWAAARRIRPEEYEATARGRSTRQPAAKIAARYAAYVQAKARRDVVDFDDLLAACLSAMEHDPGFASAQRWRFRHLFVDEFQDVNPLQFALLEAWRGDRWDVFVVGDPHQSIYGWNGAEPRLLQDLHTAWPPLEVLHLDRTHRSTPQITAAAAAVVSAAGLDDRHPVATGADGPLPVIRSHVDERREIEFIATSIRRRQGGDLRWKHFAVLARTTDRVESLDRGLRALGIPTRRQRAAALLADPAVRAILQRLRGQHRLLATTLADIAEDASTAAVDTLVKRAEQLITSEPQTTAAGFVDWAHANLTDVVDERATNAVTVSTIHAAKGLEWPVVHVAGCEQGSIPVSGARTRAARDEEARLLYVALTRAEAELHLHWSSERIVKGRVRPTERSAFLDGFEDAVAASAAVMTDAPRSVTDLRDHLPGPPPRTPLEIALREWRTHRARLARSSTEAVLPDVTLDAMVAEPPLDVGALAALPGLGPARRRRHGAELLDIIRRNRSTHLTIVSAADDTLSPTGEPGS